LFTCPSTKGDLAANNVVLPTNNGELWGVDPEDWSDYPTDNLTGLGGKSDWLGIHLFMMFH
jgi:hypothetical protein